MKISKGKWRIKSGRVVNVDKVIGTIGIAEISGHINGKELFWNMDGKDSDGDEEFDLVCPCNIECINWTCDENS